MATIQLSTCLTLKSTIAWNEIVIIHALGANSYSTSSAVGGNTFSADSITQVESIHAVRAVCWRRAWTASITCAGKAFKLPIIGQIVSFLTSLTNTISGTCITMVINATKAFSAIKIVCWQAVDTDSRGLTFITILLRAWLAVCITRCCNEIISILTHWAWNIITYLTISSWTCPTDIVWKVISIEAWAAEGVCGAMQTFDDRTRCAGLRLT